MERVAGDSLRCPICLDLPEDHVFQCRNGHAICRECSESLRHCPQCRVEFETVKIRNRVLENILDNMAADCPYKTEGCTKTILRKELSQHKECCEFKSVEFCTLVGFIECNFSSLSGLAIFNHMQKEHAVPLIDSGEISLPKESLYSSAFVPLGFMTPNIETAESTDKFLLCLHQTFGECPTISVIAIYFGQQDDSLWNVQYNIKDEKSRSKILWKIPPISFKDKRVDSYLSSPPVQIPISHLEKIQANNDPCILADVTVSIHSSRFADATSNEEMVEQLKLNGIIKSDSVMQMMRAVDRGLFITDKRNAYKNEIWKEDSLHLPSPAFCATVLEELDIRPGMYFLNIGSGSGYLSKMIGMALGESGHNYGIDCNSEAVSFAKEAVKKFQSIHNHETFCSPYFCLDNFYHGHEKTYEGLCDRLYCGAECPKEEVGTLRKLLKDGGICIVPVDGTLLKLRRTSEIEFESIVIMKVNSAPLVKPFNSYW